MAPTSLSFAHLRPDELLALVPRLAGDERHALAALVAALAELDARGVLLGEGYSSLYAYCTRRLHLSEGAACRRIDAAKVGRRYPVVFGRLADGTLTLDAVSKLRDLLTDDNHVAVLDAARHCRATTQPPIWASAEPGTVPVLARAPMDAIGEAAAAGALHLRGRSTSAVDPQWRAVRIRRPQRSSMRPTRPARIPPPRAVRDRRRQ
jgi:hypothetical protein